MESISNGHKGSPISSHTQTFVVVRHRFPVLLRKGFKLIQPLLESCSVGVLDQQCFFLFPECVDLFRQRFVPLLDIDIAYIYVSAPIKAIRCKCRIEVTNIPVDVGEDDGYVLDEAFCSKAYRRYMDLKMEKCFDNPMLGYQMLLMNGLSGPIRSQRRVPLQLQKYLENIQLKK